jgi:hypothetical protein
MDVSLTRNKICYKITGEHFHSMPGSAKYPCRFQDSTSISISGHSLMLGTMAFAFARIYRKELGLKHRARLTSARSSYLVVGSSLMRVNGGLDYGIYIRT